MNSHKVFAGESIIDEIARQMVVLVEKTKRPVRTRVNGIDITANPGDDFNTIVRHYYAESNRRHEEYVNSSEYEERQREAEEAKRRHDVILEEALAAAPKKMMFRDKEAWDRVVVVGDYYRSSIIRFAERWARLMESRMANGDTLEACAEGTSSLAYKKGITPFMYRCAVSILSQAWIHGEQLQLWHNLGNDGQGANESDGAFNPIFLSLN